jgi:hypothetical protein
MAVFELENLKPLPEGEINPLNYYKEPDNFVLEGRLRGKHN